MGITILYEVHHFCGSFTSIIDTAYNIRKFIPEVQFKIKFGGSHSFSSFLSWYRMGVGDFDFPHFIPDDVISDDIIITSQILATHSYQKILRSRIECDKLIILDTAGFIWADDFGYLSEIYNHFPTAPQIYYLCNPYNQKFKSGLEYYHKFSPERLGHLEQFAMKDNGKVLTTRSQMYEKIKYLNIAPWQYNRLIWERWYRNFKANRENIGKLLFEFRYFNKPVYYSNKNKDEDDGLTHYLKLFNIDDNISQNLSISRHEIEDKLFMKEDDLLLELLT